MKQPVRIVIIILCVIVLFYLVLTLARSVSGAELASAEIGPRETAERIASSTFWTHSD
jgi:hypothetical protein